MDSEGHISFTTDRQCDLGEGTPLTTPPSHCETYNTHLPGLAETPVRLENVCKVEEELGRPTWDPVCDCFRVLSRWEMAQRTLRGFSEL